jgi:thiol-disulfide isomerase/thioredoxin
MSRSVAIGTGAGVVIVVIVVILVLLAVRPSSTPAPTSTGSLPAGSSGNADFAAAVKAITTVPASVLNTVGVGNHPASSSGAENPLNLGTSKTGDLPRIDGKPVLFFFGAEWCPFCAAERWSLIVALSHFGTFSGLGPASSSSSDYAPDTQTFTFYGSTYTSDDIALASVEIEDEKRNTLQTPNAAELKVLQAWDPATSFPFIDLAGKYLGGLPLWDDPIALAGLSRTQIAAAVRDPSSAVGATIDANANYITAGICAVDGDVPATVCSSPGVKAATAQLGNVPDATPITG